MKEFITVLLIYLFTFFFVSGRASAVVDPLAVPNNTFGMHILFPEELEQAAKLVNSNGGDFGYVTIPIQAGDKDLVKWQAFMDAAKKHHVIPVVRLATEGDYFNTKVWRKPEATDVLDFANFLGSLEWPTKNRYVVVFNEVNRGDEWGGSVNPAEYADLLYYATIVFKARSDDFFIISAGLDNAAPNNEALFMNEYDFLQKMYQFFPNVFDNVDGFASHSYPNPGFRQSPISQTRSSIASFRYERDLVQSLTGKKLPIFITETGWSQDAVLESTIASYYTIAFSTVWNNDGIVAVTPFLLQGGQGVFNQFSFIHDGEFSLSYNTLLSFSKIKGTPVQPLFQKIVDEEILGTEHMADFSSVKEKNELNIVLPDSLKTIVKWLLKLE